MRPDSVTRNGQYIFFEDPSKTEIILDDLRFSTMNICRYNGHLPWRLVQHLALCVLLGSRYLDEGRYPIPIGQAAKPLNVDPKKAIQCLAAHDLPEVYVQDIVTGLKKLLPDYQKIETKWEQYICDYFNIPHFALNEDYRYFVKAVDMKALLCEMQLLNHPGYLLVLDSVSPLNPMEIDTFRVVEKMTLEECWAVVWAALTEKY